MCLVSASSSFCFLKGHNLRNTLVNKLVYETHFPLYHVTTAPSGPLEMAILDKPISFHYLYFPKPFGLHHLTPPRRRSRLAADPPRVAGMLVPKHRHSDWIFSAHSGRLQLLLSSPGISRLILIGDCSHDSPPIYRCPLKDDDTSCDDELGVSLKPLFLALSPKCCFKHGIPEIPILSYQDKLAGACEVEVGCDLGSDNDVDTKSDVIMVDLDSSDARDGLIAPPLEFVRKHVLLSARSILSDNGILAINVIPPSTSFYRTLIHEFRDVFNELYEIDVGNRENFILIAVTSPLMPSSDCENCFLSKLGKAISGAYLNSIKKI